MMLSILSCSLVFVQVCSCIKLKNIVDDLISTGMQITFGTLMNNWAIDFNLYFTRYTTAVFLFLTSEDYNMSFFVHFLF